GPRRRGFKEWSTWARGPDATREQPWRSSPRLLPTFQAEDTIMTTQNPPTKTPAPTFTHEEANRVIARIGKQRFEALDPAQKRYAHLLAGYGRALDSLIEAADLLAAADPAGF